jgi:hypothetical protein
MIVPSILSVTIGAAILIAFAVLLRYVANDARELARTRARASYSANPIGANSFSTEDSPVPIHKPIADRLDAARAVIDPNRRGASNGEQPCTLQTVSHRFRGLIRT